MNNQKRKLSLSIKLIGITSILICLVLGFIIIETTKDIKDHVIEAETHNLLQMSDTIKELLDGEIRGISEQVKLKANNSKLKNDIVIRDKEALLKYATDEAESNQYIIGHVIADSNAVVIAAADKSIIGVDLLTIPYFKAVWDGIVNSNNTYINNTIIPSGINGHPILAVGNQIVSDKGVLLGVLVASIDLTIFYEKQLAHKVFLNSGYGILIANDGTVVSHIKPEYNFTSFAENDFEIEIRKNIKNNVLSGSVNYLFENEKKTMFYTVLDAVPWHVALTVYEEDLTELSRILSKDMSIISVISLVIIILLLILSIYLFLTKPVESVTRQLVSGASNLESASQQIASSSQQLSAGNSELAASIEEITSSLEELQSVIELNTKNINESELLMKDTNANSLLVSEDMGNLSIALDDIGSNSEQIVNIVKVIEDIAFQTNILALNAAVEAGRAGEAGSGFAVVADQVKELAQKSSESAKETAKLIKTTIDSITKGQTIGRTVKSAQDKASDMSNNVTILLNEVNRASKEQMKGVNQITKAITQTNSVVQQTAASAEESASASEELLGQSEELNGVVDDLNLLIKGSKNRNNTITSEDVSKKHDTAKSVVKRISVEKKTDKFNPEEIIPMNDEFKEF